MIFICAYTQNHPLTHTHNTGGDTKSLHSNMPVNMETEISQE